MLLDADQKLVKQFKRSMAKHGVPLHKTIVFGSRARGEAGPDSDLDVLVLVEHVDPAYTENRQPLRLGGRL